jgi:rare lipoprotein A
MSLRGGRLRIALLAVFVLLTGTAYASSAQPQGSGGAIAGQAVPKAGPTRIHTSVTRHVRRGDSVRVRGKLRPAQGGRRFAVQVLSKGGWRTVHRSMTGRGGRFRGRWRPASAGSYRLRVRMTGRGPGRAAAASGPSRRVNVYRPGAASWYGPGLYGNGTSCGGMLTPSRIGVAHKSLPCGTRVTA